MWRSIRIYSGFLIWMLLALGLFFSLTSHYEALSEPQKQMLPQIQSYFWDSPRTLNILFEQWVWILPGDQIFIKNAQGQATLVGYVLSTGKKDPFYVCHLELFPEFFQKITDGTRFYYVQTKAEKKVNVPWILNTLIPPEKKKEIALLIDQFFEKNQIYISEILIPLTKSILKEIFDTFENQLPDLWKKHETRLFTIFEKHKLNTFEKELLPLLQDELWPLIKEEATPTIEGIGLELWSTFPKWSIAWKSVYQKIPGTDDDHVRKRWERYLAENVTPVIKLWTPEILKVLKRILIKTSKNPKISEALKKSLSEILNDTEFLAELMEIVRELFLQNELLRERLKKRVEEPEFQKQLQFLSARFEPYLTEIFHSILLDKKGEGISPNLAKVLRAELLRKDTRFIYVEFENMGLQPKELHFIGITRSNPFD